MTVLRFLALVVVLNLVRYVVGFAIEPVLIFPGLSAAMEESSGYFNNSFSSLDWATSLVYNFVLWLGCTWAFHLMRPGLRGGDLAASLKCFALLWLLFASISAIYMNHYSHPKAFYLWNVADAVLAFGVVGVTNGWLYRRLMGSAAAPAAPDLLHPSTIEHGVRP